MSFISIVNNLFIYLKCDKKKFHDKYKKKIEHYNIK